jgi:excisionase family DNA binding protein
MSVSEAAAAIGISVTALRDRIRNGQVRADRVGQRVLLVPTEEVERLRGTGRMKPGPKPRAHEDSAFAEYRRDEREHQESLDEGRERIRTESSEPPAREP